jgi:hypothetical protein
MSIVLKRFSVFAYGHDNVAPEVFVNPAQIAYVQPRIITRGHAEATDGTLLYFQQEAGVLAVRESIGLVVATLQSGKNGLCRDCYEVLPESWMSPARPAASRSTTASTKTTKPREQTWSHERRDRRRQSYLHGGGGAQHHALQPGQRLPAHPRPA